MLDPNIPYSAFLDSKEIDMIIWGGSIKQIIIEPGEHSLYFSFIHMWLPFRSKKILFELGPNERIHFKVGYRASKFFRFLFTGLYYPFLRKKFYIDLVRIDRMQPDEKVYEILG